MVPHTLELPPSPDVFPARLISSDFPFSLELLRVIIFDLDC